MYYLKSMLLVVNVNIPLHVKCSKDVANAAGNKMISSKINGLSETEIQKGKSKDCGKTLVVSDRRLWNGAWSGI